MPERALQEAPRYFGKYRGQVTKNDDSERMGRLEVIVPQVLGDAKVWAMPCVAYAGKDVGFFAMPKVGTGVWVEFEAGDARYPIWTGCVWAKGDISAADAKPEIKFLKTEQFTLRIDDGAGEVVFKDKSGSEITMRSTGPISLTVVGRTVDVKSTGGGVVNVTGTSVSVNRVLVVS